MNGRQPAVHSRRLGAGDPRRISHYRLVARLGRGGMGQVYLARSRGGRPVAVKVVAQDIADDPEFRRRFADEVKAARKVGGFHTAQVVDAGPKDAQPWLVTAYIPGPSLQEAVQAHGPLPSGALRVLGAGLAEGLAAIHRSKLVHRDLKPANVILADDGPRVIDFGISRALDGSSATNSVLGTPGYMSPEQFQGRDAGPASDVFALGCVLVYAASGHSPYGEGNGLVIQYRTINEKPDLAGVPEHLLPFLMSCLDHEPRRRPTVDQALAEFADPSGDSAWPPPGIEAMVLQRRALGALPPPEEPSGRGGGRSRILVFTAIGVLLAAAGAWTATAWPDSGRSGGASTDATVADRSMAPCDVLDNAIAERHMLTDTGSPGGYDSGSQRVRTCRWATAEFGDPDPGYEGYFTLAYGPASLEMIQENRHRFPTDLSDLPGAEAYANSSEFETACEVTWRTSFGRVSVYADEPPNVIGGVGCDAVADFARSVFPKVPT
ncbi:serine/threonine-protein kinase [Streptomyces sp. 4N509B]|uniref:serine/threonine-protein kinase n=1 Tax=Streptomyces sp. 4N509B TaxID=3457413 RepID=UPI003FD2A869